MSLISAGIHRVWAHAFLLCMFGANALAQDDGVSASVVKVAAISFVPTKFDLSGNAKRLETLFRKASKGGARIAVSPEGSLEGYVVNEIISGEAPPKRMNDVAITIDNPIIKGFEQLARELQMCLVLGFAERIGDDVFNCAAFIDDTGRVCGKYHKMQLAEGYDDSWWFNRLGQKSRAFNTPFGRCGILICNDRWNSQLARIPALDGAQFLVIPSFGSRSVAQDEAVLSRGQENGIPIIEANVGVTLIVSDDRIAAVDRREEGITFSDIRIPPPRPVDIDERNRVERKFLNWRLNEMKVRYKETLKRRHNESGK